MKRAIRNSICRIDVIPEGAGATSVSRGTGFLVGPNLILTALHVVADRRTQPPTPYPGKIQLDFPQHKTAAAIHENSWDPKEDWVLLRCDAPPPSEPLPLAKPPEQNCDWLTYGFPDANPRDGMVQTGSVENFEGSLDGAPVFQLFSRQAAAGKGAPVKGLSGGPVIIGQQVVGILRFALMKEGETVAGTLYGCPVERPVSRLPGLLKLSEPVPPTKWDAIDVKWRKHQRRVLGAVGLMALIIIGFIVKEVADPFRTPMIAALPFEIDGEAAASLPSPAIMQASVVNALQRAGGIHVLDREHTRKYLKKDEGIDFDGLKRENVGHVLNGQAVKIEGLYKLMLTISETKNKGQIWSDEIPYDAGKFPSLPGTIADMTRRALKVRSTTEETKRVVTPVTTNSAAFISFQRGNHLLDMVQMDGPRTYAIRFNDQHAVEMGILSPEEWKAVVEAYREATKADPQFAHAWARLAQASAMQVNPYGMVDKANQQQAEDALKKAEQLNPELADVHIARGHAKYRFQTDYAGALQEYLKALKLEPNNGRLLISVGLTQRLLGQDQQAVESLALATKLNPENWPMQTVMAESYRRIHRYKEAHELTQRALASGARSALPYVARANLLAIESADFAGANAALHAALAKGNVTVPDLFRATTLSMMLFRMLDDDLRQKMNGLTVTEANGPYGSLYNTSYYLAKADLNPGPLHAGIRKEFYQKAAEGLSVLPMMKLAGINREPWMYAQLAVALGGLGQAAEAREAIEEGAALAKKNQDAICQMIIEDFRIHMSQLLGDKAATLKLIEAARGRSTDYSPAWMKKDPLFASLRSDKEFVRLTTTQ